MKNNFLKRILFITSLVILTLSSCEKPEDQPSITADNLKGLFVVCEGGFGYANGEITYYNSETGETIKNLYYSINSTVPGDVIQSFEVVDTLGFIVVNNSQKVIVVNMKDFKVVRTIEGFSYPRSVIRADANSVYISNGNGFSDNYIYSISLITLEKTDSLELSTGPEKLISHNSKIFAAISGGWNNDGNSVIEIDPSSFSVVNTFTVLSVPVDLTSDINNNLWVYSKGIPDYSNYPDVTYSDAGISRISLASKTVNSFPISDMRSSGINNISTGADGSTVYFLNDALYSMSVTATTLPTAKLVDQPFYGMDVDPETGDIVCLDAVNSKAVVYSSSGMKQFDFETATFPNSVIFSY